MAEPNDAPAPPTGPAGSPPQNRFFGWMRSLGIVRGNGWIGGVCGGIAARLGIDPLIVRGFAVVIAILGGPVFLFYAAAWLLLPDAQDHIHLERLIAGHLEPAVVAIAVIALLSFLPVTQGIWWAGAQFWSEPFWPASVGRTLWSLIVVGLIIALIVWAARTSRFTSRGGEAGRRTASAPPAASGAVPRPDTETTGADAAAAFGAASGVGGTAGNTYSFAAAPPPPAPSAPTTVAGPEDLEAWKRSQVEWKMQHDTWRAQQDADQRIVRQQRSAEIRAQSHALAAQADAARRQRRLANPRTCGAYVGITFGVAILAGAIAAAVASGVASGVVTAGVAGSGAGGSAAAAEYAITIGFAVATLAFGLAIILAGALRRRSGFLSFVSVLLMLTTVLTALPPRGRDLVLGYAQDTGVTDARVFVPIGAYSVYLNPNDQGGTTSETTAHHTTRVIDIEQGIGGVEVYIVRGLTVRVEAIQRRNPGSMTARTLTTAESIGQETTRERMPDGNLRTSISYGNAKNPDVLVRVTQWVGSVNVVYDISRATEDSGNPTSAPSGSATPSVTPAP
jgi:phage shock protein PspC (stress-responsive transcriptional regulator)